MSLKPLYRFGLNTEDGSIEVRKIECYETKKLPDGRLYYRYRGSSQWNYAREENFDQLKNNGVYTFNPDIEHARSVIFKALSDKSNDLYNQYQKTHDLCCKLWFWDADNKEGK